MTSHAILGLVRPPGRVTGGRVLLDGTDLRTLAPEELRSVRGPRISYVPQNPRSALNLLLRIERQMRNMIVSHERRSPARESKVDERCRTMLAAVGIPDPDSVLRAYPHQLSGGMAQRVVIAIALLLGPELIIADEPTSGLDVIVQAQILELFTRATRERGSAVLLVTHDLGVVAHYCQRVAVMYAGEIVERGMVGEIFRSPAIRLPPACWPRSRWQGRRCGTFRGRPHSCIARRRPAPSLRAARSRPTSAARSGRRGIT